MYITTKHYCKKCNNGIEPNKEWRLMYDFHIIEENYCLNCLLHMSGLKRKT